MAAIIQHPPQAGPRRALAAVWVPATVAVRLKPARGRCAEGLTQAEGGLAPDSVCSPTSPRPRGISTLSHVEVCWGWFHVGGSVCWEGS